MIIVSESDSEKSSDNEEKEKAKQKKKKKSTNAVGSSEQPSERQSGADTANVTIPIDKFEEMMSMLK